MKNIIIVLCFVATVKAAFVNKNIVNVDNAVTLNKLDDILKSMNDNAVELIAELIEHWETEKADDKCESFIEKIVSYVNTDEFKEKIGNIKEVIEHNSGDQKADARETLHFQGFWNNLKEQAAAIKKIKQSVKEIKAQIDEIITAICGIFGSLPESGNPFGHLCRSESGKNTPEQPQQVLADPYKNIMNNSYVEINPESVSQMEPV